MPIIKSKSVVFKRIEGASGPRKHGRILDENQYKICDDGLNPDVGPGGRHEVTFKAGFEHQGIFYSFIFGIIRGSRDGNMLCLASGVAVQYWAGLSDIDVIGVYVPKASGGGSGGQPVVWVDAFDVEKGVFSDAPEIVEVSIPGPSGQIDLAATAQANRDGDIFTQNTSWLVRALPGLPGSMQRFLEWRLYASSTSPNQPALIEQEDREDYLVPAGADQQLLVAFYKVPDGKFRPKGINLSDLSKYVAERLRIPPLDPVAVPLLLMLASVLLIAPGKPQFSMNSKNATLGVLQALLGVAGVVVGGAGVVGSITASRTRD